MITIELPHDATPYQLRRIAAALKVMAEYPPEGLEMGSGPLTVHSREGLREQAEAALKKANEDQEVVHQDLDTAPPIEPAVEPPADPLATTTVTPPADPVSTPADPLATTTTAPPADPLATATKPPADPTPAPPKTDDEFDALNETARGLMLQVTAAGMSVPDLKAKLAETIEGDVTKLDSDGLRKAIAVMEALPRVAVAESS